ncbi:MAG: AAA family ATPase [Chloroflexi bacterium]|nr:AAA family ATPase [Chloroflexota bacterium]
MKPEVAKVIVGQQDVVRHTLIGVLSSGHVLLEGVPGLGKTMLVRTFAQAMSLDFSRISSPRLDAGPTSPAPISWKKQPPASAQFRFQQGPVFANLILADEINRATPKTQSALLEAMQEHTVTVANSTYLLPEPFSYWRRRTP